MEQSDKRAFKAKIEMLGLTFQRDIDAPLLQVWWRALEDLPIERISSAVDAAVKECERFPVPAKIRELARRQPVQALCPLALPELRSERERVMESWKGHEDEMKRDIGQLKGAGPLGGIVGVVIDRRQQS